MRAFEVLTKAEYDIRASANPRYHLEMALLRWVHLRKLVPLSDLIEGLQGGGTAASAGRGSGAAPAPASPATPRPRPASRRRDRARVGYGQAVEARREAAARSEPVAVGDVKNRISRRDPQVEEVLPRHRCGAGAENRRPGRPDRLRLRAAAPGASRTARSVAPLFRGACKPPRRPPDDGDVGGGSSSGTRCPIGPNSGGWTRLRRQGRAQTRRGNPRPTGAPR